MTDPHPSDVPPTRTQFREPGAVADEGSGDWIPTLIASSPTPGRAAPALTAEAAASAGRYRPVRFHARGGLGEVFVAEDAELHREVALKRLPDADAEGRGRFLLEAEITARLEHPGIVPVYGLGADGAGRPCYAMRFIQGETLHEALKRFHQADRRPRRDPGERRLALRKLVNHLVAVANAVAYAHARGILHRDLKPANIMLGKFGETLVVDWGLAKPFARDDAAKSGGEATLVPQTTGTGQTTVQGVATGTPAYMSPEQAGGRWDLVGPASDLFSLGATLYAVLTGQAPYPDLDVGTVLDKARRGAFPPPRQVKRDVPRPLEAVCRKALAYQPEDRYAGAQDFAADLEAWLADEPVAAYREPLPARLARWGRRHKALVVGAVSLLLTAVVGLAVGTLLIAHQKELTERALLGEKAARAEADAAAASEREALRQAAEADRKALEVQASAARKAVEFVELQIGVLEGMDPLGLEGLGRRPAPQAADADAALALLAQGGNSPDELRDNPLLQASVLNTLGNVYRGLARYDLAEPRLRKALDLRRAHLGRHPDTAVSLHNLGWLLYDRGDFTAAEQLLTEALALRRQLLGGEDPQTASTLFVLASLKAMVGDFDAAEALFRALLALREKRGDAHDVALAQLGLAAVMIERQQVLEALAWLQKALKRLTSDAALSDAVLKFQTGVALHLSDVALTLPLAEQNLRDSLRLARPILGDQHPYVAIILHELGRTLEKRGDRDQAERHYREALDIARRSVGLGHPRVVVAVKSLAELLTRRGKRPEGRQLFEEVIRAQRQRYPNSPLLAEVLTQYASFLDTGDEAEAVEKVYREALALYRKHTTYRPHQLTACLNNLANLLSNNERPADAEPLLREVLPLTQAQYGAGHENVAIVFNNLARALMNLNRFDEAEPYVAQALAIHRGKLTTSKHLVYALEQRGRLLHHRRRLDQAEADYREAVQLARGHLKDSPGERAHTLEQLANVRVERGDFAGAAAALAEAAPLEAQRYGIQSYYAAEVWRDLALARLGAGDDKGYREACAQLIKDFGSAKDVKAAHAAARTLVLVPGAVADAGVVLRLAARATTAEPGNARYRVTHGAALLRAGQPAEAVRELQQVKNPSAATRLLLALALCGAGQPEEGKRLAEKALQAGPAKGLSWQERREWEAWRREVLDRVGMRDEKMQSFFIPHP